MPGASGLEAAWFRAILGEDGYLTGQVAAIKVRSYDQPQAGFDIPVDLVGTSTGGSIAQQLATEHPHAAHRLVLISTACRLSSHCRDLQHRVAVRLRAGQTRPAVSLLGASLVPPGLWTLIGGLAWAAAGNSTTRTPATIHPTSKPRQLRLQSQGVPGDRIRIISVRRARDEEIGIYEV